MILYLTALILALPLGFQCTEIHAAIGADQCNSASCETEPEGSCLLQSNARKLRVGAHTTLQERTTRRVRTGMSRIERCLRKKPYDPREEKNHQRLLLKRLVVSNLAGAGPNVSSEKVLRYGGVWNIPGKGWIDLIVSAVSPYTPYDVTQNGLFGEPRHASSGMLSVAAGTSVNLSFSFVWNETGLPAVIPHVNVSVLGISANGDGSMAKSVNIYDFTRYYINNDTTLLQAKGPTGGIRFTGTDTAVVNEKPYYFFMSDRQAAQALDVEYVVSTFYMTFSVGPGTGCVNFHFGGRAAISECLGVPKGWGKPSCGVVPKTVPLNEVGWRTVQTGHPLCRETDVDIFMRRVITAQGYCLGSEQSFGSFKRYFNGQCALHDGVKDGLYPKQDFAGILKHLKDAISKPPQCGGGWIRYGPPVGPPCDSSGLVQSMIVIPDMYSKPGSGRLGEIAGLSERGYRMVAMSDSLEDMVVYIKRVMVKLDLKLVDEKALRGFAPHYMAACGLQSFDALVFELQLIGFALPCRCGAWWINSSHPIFPTR